MTREEIVSALRFCAHDGYDCSSDCPVRIAQFNCALHDIREIAADLIENQAREIEALTQANAAKTERLETFRWIPVEEALPKPFVSVLGYMPDEEPLPTVHECYYVEDRNEWYSMWCYGAKKVTHWAPMPEKEASPC